MRERWLNASLEKEFPVFEILKQSPIVSTVYVHLLRLISIVSIPRRKDNSESRILLSHCRYLISNLQGRLQDLRPMLFIIIFDENNKLKRWITWLFNVYFWSIQCLLSAVSLKSCCTGYMTSYSILVFHKVSKPHFLFIRASITDLQLNLGLLQH